MTTQDTLCKAPNRAFELGTAVAIGAALTATFSPAVGVGVGAALIVTALREKKNLTLREGFRLAGIAIAVGLTATAAISIFDNWSAFKDGVVQGYQSR